MRINFVWQGLSKKSIYGQWNDGLREAINILAKQHEVKYFEPWDDIPDGDVILYWEGLSTWASNDREGFRKVAKNPIPKILLFAGGPIKKEWAQGFQLFLVESKINEDEFGALGLPWMRAFGVNIDIMKPEKQPKVFDAVFPGTCASWKRQSLFSRALKSKGILCGRYQENDSIGFMSARKEGTLVLPELASQAVNSLYNASVCCVNTSEYWGGGQRVTLEAMAAGIPVIVMSDSPKNREYVEESGAGLVVEPTEEDIRGAIESVRNWTEEQKMKGVDYIHKKWTSQHYADGIIRGINQVLHK